MAEPPPAPNGLTPFADATLATCLSDLADGARVLWLGSTEHDGPASFSETASSVLALDPHVHEAIRQSGVRVSRLRPGPLDFREGSFDLVVVPDVGVLGPDAGERLEELQDAAGRDGLVVVGCPAERDYEVFYETLADRFDAVRVYGQAPISGWALADFAPADDEVVVDGTLVDDEGAAPWRYVALCGRQPESLAAYTVVPAPVRSGRPVAPEVEASAPDGDEEELRREIDQAHAHAEDLERALDAERQAASELRSQLADLERQLVPSEEGAGPTELEAEFERVEEALGARGREILDLRAEIDRRGTLVRDLVEEMSELRAGRDPAAPPSNGSAGGSGSNGIGNGGLADEGAKAGAALSGDGDVDALRGQRDRAVTRALEAEAKCAEIRFRADELAARLESGASGTDPRLEGTIRGLRSRAAEMTELRELAEGRLALAESELQAARERERDLERRLAAQHEHFELELVRARGGAPEHRARLEARERELAGRVGDLSGQLMACREAAETLAQERDRARSEALRLTSYVSAVETRLDGVRLGYERRIAELADAPRVSVAPPTAPPQDVLEALRGECAGLRARLDDRERALEAHRANEEPVAAEGEAAAAAGGLSAAERDRYEARLVEAERRSLEEQSRATELASLVAARDAMVTRLQLELTDHEQEVRRLEERMDGLHEENQRIRGALVDASNAVDDRDRVASRAEAAEAERDRDRSRAAAAEAQLAEQRRQLDAAFAERDRALAGLRETRELLASLHQRSSEDEGDATGRGVTAVGIDAPVEEPEQRSTAGELESLQTQLRQLESQQAEKDTLARSLAAQVEERDERIRALERRVEADSAPDSYSEAVQREMMEMQERVARLSEEVEHERAARRAAEADSTEAPARRADSQALKTELDQRQAELEQVRGKLTSYERDAQSMRQACVQARHGLEELLGAATASGDPSSADRIGSLLRLLSRF